MRKLAIIGAGGHGKVVADCAEQQGNYDEIFFLDAVFPGTEEVLHWPIKGTDKDWEQFIEEAEFIVAIGNNKVRLDFAQRIQEANGNLATIKHPSAQISQYATINAGTVVFANAVINCSANIGIAAIINTSATIDHDCEIGDACHISPGANIAGGVVIGDCSWVGIASNIIQCLTVSQNVMIGAGSTVTENITIPGTYVGSPAKIIYKS